MIDYVILGAMIIQAVVLGVGMAWLGATHERATEATRASKVANERVNYCLRMFDDVTTEMQETIARIETLEATHE